MPLRKISTIGAIITLTAVGGANSTAELECLTGDLIIGEGTFPTIEDPCHKSKTIVYDKVCIASFPEGTLETFLSGDKTDAFTILADQWHRCKGDFDTSVAGNSNRAKLKIAFDDEDNTVMEFEAFCTSIEDTFKLKDRVMRKITFQQTGFVTRT